MRLQVCNFFYKKKQPPEVFCEKGVHRNFTKFIGEYLCQSLFFNKVAGLRPQACNFIKKETMAQVFSCESWEISKNTFFTEHVWATASAYSFDKSTDVQFPRLTGGLSILVKRLFN